MANLLEIEGVGERYAPKLRAAGVRGTGDLLKKGSSKQGRKQLAEKAGVDPDLILEWVNHVDLMRVRGIGSEYSDLLEAAGVDTIVELARRNPQNLYTQLAKINMDKKLCRRMPTQAQVQGWVEQAKELPRIIGY